VLETGGNVVELKNLLAVAIQAVGRGDIPGALETLLGVGSKTETFLGQLSQGNTATTVDELGGLLFKAQGPLGLEALGLAKLKGKLAGKNAQEVMYNFANIASGDFIAGGIGKDPVVLSPLPAQLPLFETVGVQTSNGKVRVFTREHTFFSHDTGSAHTLRVSEIKRAESQTSVKYTSQQDTSVLGVAMNEAARWVNSNSRIGTMPDYAPATVQLTQGDNNVISLQKWMSNGTDGKLVSVSINEGRGAGFLEVPPSVFNALPEGLRTDVSREGGTDYSRLTGKNERGETVMYWQATYVRQNSQGQKEVVTKLFTPGDHQLGVTITQSPNGSLVYNQVPGNYQRLPGPRNNITVPAGGRLSYSDNGNRADVVNSAGTQREKYTRVADGKYELVRRSEHLLHKGQSTDLRLVYKAKEGIYQLVRQRADGSEQMVADRLTVGPDGKPLLPLEALGGLDVSRLETPRGPVQVVSQQVTQEERGELEQALDMASGVLDLLGLVPVVGEAADAANVALNLTRGRPLEAALSAISLIPIIGDAVGKTAKAALRAADPALARRALEALRQVDVGAFVDTLASNPHLRGLSEQLGRAIDDVIGRLDELANGRQLQPALPGGGSLPDFSRPLEASTPPSGGGASRPGGSGGSGSTPLTPTTPRATDGSAAPQLSAAFTASSKYARATALPVLVPNSKAWRQVVQALKTGGPEAINNVRVASASDARRLLDEAFPRNSAQALEHSRTYTTGGPRSYQFHPPDAQGINDLSHIKWNTPEGEGHIFFGNAGNSGPSKYYITQRDYDQLLRDFTPEELEAFGIKPGGNRLGQDGRDRVDNSYPWPGNRPAH